MFQPSQEGWAYGPEPLLRKQDPEWDGCGGGREDWSLNGKWKVLVGPAGREGVEPLLEP